MWCCDRARVLSAIRPAGRHARRCSLWTAGQLASASSAAGTGWPQGSVPEVMEANGGEIDDVFVLQPDQPGREPAMNMAAT